MTRPPTTDSDALRDLFLSCIEADPAFRARVVDLIRGALDALDALPPAVLAEVARLAGEGKDTDRGG